MGEAVVVTHARRLGARVIAKELRHRALSHSLEVGLRCDLGRLPPHKEAKIPVRMEPCLGPFRGFSQELGRTTGTDYGRMLHRQRLLEAGVQTLHVAWSADREPAYVQWLITVEDRPALDAFDSGFWPSLRQGEVLLEFAYTFTPFRGMGVMSDAMGQLLRIAASRGASFAYTYVGVDNIASLRGCARVGFELDHMKESVSRIGLRRSGTRPATASERAAWAQATARRSE
jgi:hypothetical protein